MQFSSVGVCVTRCVWQRLFVDSSLLQWVSELVVTTRTNVFEALVCHPSDCGFLAVTKVLVTLQFLAYNGDRDLHPLEDLGPVGNRGPRDFLGELIGRAYRFLMLTTWYAQPANSVTRCSAAQVFAHSAVVRQSIRRFHVSRVARRAWCRGSGPRSGRGGFLASS